jgi:molecular chaperone GrpE
MSEPKGPKIDLPEDLVAELEEESGAPTPPSPATGAPSGGGEAAGERGEAAPKSPQDDADALKTERDELKDRYLRLAAEFENYKRRILKERQDLLNYANETIIKELLETVDNLERALGHARASEEGVDSKTLREGVELTLRGLTRVLKHAGVRAIGSEGEAFDPQTHEAVCQVETREHSPGVVVEVHKKGYLLRDRLLRPALVSISRRPAEES